MGGGSYAAPFLFLLTCAACMVHEQTAGAVMLVKALKSFQGRYGSIRAGMMFNCEPGYFLQLAKNKLAEKVSDQDAPAGAPGPSDNRNIPEAPGKGGKENPDDQGGKSEGSEPPPAGGAEPKSASLRADLASRGTTSHKSAVGVTSKSITSAKKKRAREVADPAAKGNQPGE